jgi:hypothetical protein
MEVFVDDSGAHRSERVPSGVIQELMLAVPQFRTAPPVRSVFRLTGPLNEARLRRACLAVVRKHGALRMRAIPSVSDHHLVNDTRELGDILMVRTMDYQDAASLAALTESPLLDLEADGPVRFEIVRNEEREEAILLLYVHHIACDAYGTRQVVSDLWEAYRAGSAELPSPTTTYEEYLRWERSAPPALTPAQRQYLADVFSKDPDSDVLRDQDSEMRPFDSTHLQNAEAPLRDLAAAVGVTRSVATLGIAALTYARVTQRESVLIQSMFNGRSEEAHRDVAGMLMRPVILRVDLTLAGETVAEFLRRLMALWIAAVRMSYPVFTVLDLAEYTGTSFPPTLTISDATRETISSGFAVAGLRVEHIQLTEINVAAFGVERSISMVVNGADGLQAYGAFDAGWYGPECGWALPSELRRLARGLCAGGAAYTISEILSGELNGG